MLINELRRWNCDEPMMQSTTVNKITKLENYMNALRQDFRDLSKQLVSQLTKTEGSLNKPAQFPFDTATNPKEQCNAIHL